MKTEKQFRQMEQKLNKKVERLRGSLKVIRTWAKYDEKIITGSSYCSIEPRALGCLETRRLCEKVLKETEGDK